MKTEMNISLQERVDALEGEINGEKLQAEMLRKAKQYVIKYAYPTSIIAKDERTAPPDF